MDELIGFLAEAATAAVRGNADPQAAEKLRKRIEDMAAASSGSAGKVVAPRQSQPAAASPHAPTSSPGASHAVPPPKPHGAHAPNVAAAFRDRSSLLTALVAVEVLGVPPSLRPREMRGDAW
jgi:hypothetical protein